MSAQTAFDLDGEWQLGPSVVLRPEPFGALAYDFASRRLSFLRSPVLVDVVAGFGGRSARQACEAAGVCSEELVRYTRALGMLADSGMIISRRAR